MHMAYDGPPAKMACTDRSHKGQWVVTVRNANYSRFNGSRYTPSDYSEIVCQVDGSRWRSKAAYVDDLPDVEGGAR